MPTKATIIVLAFATFTQITLGRLGETPPQCSKRYGVFNDRTLTEDGERVKNLQFFKKGFGVTVEFWPGKFGKGKQEAGLIIYIKAREKKPHGKLIPTGKPLSDNEIRFFLKANRQGHTWKEDEEYSNIMAWGSILGNNKEEQQAIADTGGMWIRSDGASAIYITRTKSLMIETRAYKEWRRKKARDKIEDKLKGF